MDKLKEIEQKVNDILHKHWDFPAIGMSGLDACEKELLSLLALQRKEIVEEVKEKMPKMLTTYTEKKFEFIDYEAREYNKALSEVIKVLNEI